MADALSELHLGVRELFRILIPGFYAVALVESLAPHSDLAGFTSSAIHKGLIAALFLGLLAYGLQVHEKWFPFNIGFEQWRLRLNHELGGGSDRVHEYKYFLETSAPGIKDRIHYFSSFYYMLIELSLLSAVAALALVLNIVNVLGCLSKLTLLLFVFGISVQLSALYFPKRSDRGKTLDRIFQYGPVGLLALGLLSAFITSELQGKSCPSALSMALDWRLPCLFVAALVFERLGTRHWESVIKEQIVLVKHKSEDIKGLPRVDTNY